VDNEVAVQSPRYVQLGNNSNLSKPVCLSLKNHRFYLSLTQNSPSIHTKSSLEAIRGNYTVIEIRRTREGGGGRREGEKGEGGGGVRDLCSANSCSHPWVAQPHVVVL
jgi:hypothetical protein